MKSLARFAEYSMTGGLLWINIFIFTTLIFYQPTQGQSTIESTFLLWQNWLNVVSNSLATLDSNSILRSSFPPILSTLGIILIFCSGLILNLISPLFCVPFELLVFKNKLAHGKNQWLDEVISPYKDFLLDDYLFFIQHPFFSLKNFKQCQQQQHRYNKIYLFLISYLYTNSSAVQLEMVAENIRVWRISRALTTSLIVLCVLLTFLVITDSGSVQASHDAIALAIIIPLVLFSFSIIITTTMFSRLVDNIFSQTYQIHKKLITHL